MTNSDICTLTQLCGTDNQKMTMNSQSNATPDFGQGPATQVVDLTNCDREPIHIPGAVQPHGVLIAVRPSDQIIVQVSASARNILGVSVESLLNTSARSLFSESDLAMLLDENRYPQFRTASDLDRPDAPRRRGEVTPPSVFSSSTPVNIADRPFEAIVHGSDGLVLIELEQLDQEADSATQSNGDRLVREVHRAVALTRVAETLPALAQAAAAEVRRLAGFDRVMVYRFDENWNGEVIAEAKRDDLEPFLGLHYPASDIPAQARRLYVHNRLRFIADRDYAPSPLIPQLNPENGRPLDLSHSVLRSVSPIHIEYLRNMGVSASMSVSIVTIDGRLWGLIACHHYSGPRFVPYSARRACELVGELVSLQLVAKQESQDAAYVARMNAKVDELSAAMDRETDLAKTLTSGTPTLLDLIDCTGAAITSGKRILTVGQTPTNEQLLALGEWLDAQQPQQGSPDNELFATDALASKFSPAARYADCCSGLLAVSLTRGGRNYLMWFRPEIERTVDWAGDPRKSLQKGEDGVRLSPRGSFALWQQTVRGHSKRWTEQEKLAALDLRREVVDRILRRADELVRLNNEISRSRDEAVAARANAESANRIKDEFLATLSHELRTPLNAILGWSNLLARGGRDPEELDEGLEIIERNARAQSQLIEDLLDVSRIVNGKLRLETAPTDLANVVDAAVAAVRVAADARTIRLRTNIEYHAGQVMADAVRLQQIVWNLLSNAVKFTPKGGEVRIELKRRDSAIELSVSDTGIGIEPELLPVVFERFRQSDSGSTRKYGGLGLGLAIVKHLVELHGGTVTAASEGTGRGSRFSVLLPLMPMRRDSALGGTHSDAGSEVEPRRLPECPAELHGVRVLVVEDEADARSMIVRALQHCEAMVTAVESVAAAISALQTMPIQPDIVISDIGMPLQDGFDLIRWIRARPPELGGNLIAIALTAYASRDDRRRTLTAGFSTHLAKPIAPQELIAVVANLAVKRN